MKPCSCVVHVWIANDKGEEAVYSCRPVPPAELAEAAAGFFLVKHSDPSPVYAVTVGADGAVRCNCPHPSRTGACKHARALVAAAVLPAGLLAVLRQRSALLDEAEAFLKDAEAKQAAAEAEAQRLAEAAIEERIIHENDAQWRQEQIEELTGTVALLHERAARLQVEVAARLAVPPKRSRRVKDAA